MAIRYVLHPGPVISKSDGQTHVITAEQLARLYQIPLHECIVVRSDDGFEDQRKVAARMTSHKNLIHLHPRGAGDYRDHLHARRANMRGR